MLHARTWAEVNVSALKRNLAKVKEAAAGADVMLVVKADAYGHGATAVATTLAGHGVACFGVGDSTEALELRHAAVTTPILILGAIVKGEMEAVIKGEIGVTIHSAFRARALAHMARRMGTRVRVHLKVDTGMGRLGCAPACAVPLARAIERSPYLELEGIATHLATPGPEGDKETTRQLARFRRVLDLLKADGIEPRWRHALSSGGIAFRHDGEFNLVRPGIAVYGIRPHTEARMDLEPALSWKTQVVYLRDHRAGSRIGYGGTWKAPRRSRIATLPVGYDDGYRFAFSNKAHVLVRGRRAPVVGRVSMDYVTVDVTDVPGVRVDDAVTLVGTDGHETIRVEDLARWADTIPYEILCGLGRRVERTYGERSEAKAPGAPAAVPASEPVPAGAPGSTAFSVPENPRDPA